MLLLPLLAFIFVIAARGGGAMALAPSGAGTLERRLGEVSDWQGKPIAERRRARRARS